MESLKLKKMAAACGLALGGLVFAHGAGAVSIDLFVGGATAQDPNFEKAVVDICDDALPNSTRQKWTSTAGSTWQCTVRSGVSGLAAGTVVTISKESSGGSSNGIGPVRNGTNLTRPAGLFPTAGGCGATSTVDLDPTAGVSVFVLNPNCANGPATPPHAGLSDVEPALFGTTSGLTSAATVAGIFGVAVSDKAYRQLQAAQAITEASGFLEANAPTLRAAELRGMLSGNLTDWTGVSPTFTGVGSGSTAVKVCRRGTTSGTQKSFEVRMLGLSCNSSGGLGSNTNANDDSTENGAVVGTAQVLGSGGYQGFTGVYTVVMNNTSADVDACLTAADNQNELAIGLLGVERISGAAGTVSGGGDDTDGLVDKWHYVKLDGVFPNVANTVNGTYDNLWTEATFNRRPSGYTADQTVLMNTLQTRIGDPANITAVPFLGVAALPSNGYTWDGIAPVVKYERRTGSGNINNCQDTLTVF